jgi:hypothetical protein
MDITPDTQIQQGGKPPLLNIVGEKVALFGGTHLCLDDPMSQFRQGR